MTKKQLIHQIEQAIQELGTPTMSYAPTVEAAELRAIVKCVAARLMRVLRLLK